MAWALGDADPNTRGFETRLRSTLENLLEGAQIIDRDWRYVFINPAAALHGGRTVDELTGRTMMECFPGIETSHMFGVLHRAMETRERVAFENEFVSPDGAHKYFELLVQPVPEGLFILSLDITDRKRAEQALRKSRARSQAVIENLHDGVIIADMQGTPLHWNQAALTMHGFPRSAEGRRVIEDLTRHFELFTLNGVLIPHAHWPLARALRGEEFQDLEVRVSRPGGQWERIFAYNGAATHHADDEALAFVTIRDVTERKELQRQFARAQRMESIGALAGGIAHDLNNILMPVLMGTTILRRFGLDPRVTQTIDNIERSAKRGAALVQQVLSFARGALPTWSAIDLRDVLADVAPIVTSTFPKNITLAVDGDDDIEAITGDATQMLQLALNLCVNARDAMPNGGRITISLRNAPVSEDLAREKRVTAGRFIVLEVADEGTGMTPEVMERIFDPFFTTKEIGKGTGLGLFTVQEIVRSHGGFLEVQSEIGKGAMFRVFLPSQRAVVASPAHETEVADLPLGTGQMIMIVDDEAAILAVAKQTLEAFGYAIMTADDGAQAIALYARHHAEVSLVITDMMMPVVDGPAMIAALVRMNPNVRIMATSGSSSDDWRMRAERAGARHFLTKPYTAPLLLRMVAGILALAPSPRIR